MNRCALVRILVLVITGATFTGWALNHQRAMERSFAEEVALTHQEAERIAREVVLFTTSLVLQGQTLSDFLYEQGLDATTAARIVEHTRAVFSPRLFRAGHPIALGRSILGELRAVRYRIDPDRELWVERSGDAFRAEIKTIPSTTEVVGVSGTVRDALFNAVMDAGERPELAIALADIFGWDLDFYSDPRPGDTFRLLVEKKRYLEASAGLGLPAGSYGRILAAEYNNAGRVYQAVLFREPSGRAAYYAPDGQSMQKAFLRSPLKFTARISSRFSRSRFHPILRRHRPHLGIDYAAPAGAPVQAIGDGRVVFAGYKGGAGRVVHLRHANGYETQYLHLSSILVATGQRVAQGQIIGRVGSTGLSTGPHLDFRVLQHGAFRNFLSLKLPPALPVAKADWNEFVGVRDRWLAALPGGESLAQAPGQSAAAPSRSSATRY